MCAGRSYNAAAQGDKEAPQEQAKEGEAPPGCTCMRVLQQDLVMLYLAAPDIVGLTTFLGISGMHVRV
jgi:hypothetical protein